MSVPKPDHEFKRAVYRMGFWPRRRADQKELVEKMRILTSLIAQDLRRVGVDVKTSLRQGFLWNGVHVKVKMYGPAAHVEDAMRKLADFQKAWKEHKPHATFEAEDPDGIKGFRGGFTDRAEPKEE